MRSIFNILAFTSLLGFAHGQGLSPECTPSVALFLECYGANTVTCSQACASALELLNQDPSCDNVQEYCSALSCCPPCVSLGADVVNCEGNVLSCSDTCSVIQSPDSPTEADSPTTPPSTADSPTEVISPTSSPVASAPVSEVCAKEAAAFYACFTDNISSCNSTCTEAGLDTTNEVTCDYIKSVSDIFASCCQPCSDVGKALIECESESLSCDISDSVTPSPAMTDGEDGVTSAAPTPREQISRASTEFYLSRTLVSVLLCHVLWQALSA